MQLAAGVFEDLDAALDRNPEVRGALEPLRLVVRLAGLRVERRQNPRVGLQQVQDAVVEQRRRHVRGVAIELPHDCAGAADVALGLGELDRLQVVAAEAARREHHAVGEHRRRDRVHGRAGRFPDDGAGFQIIAAQFVHAVDDHLRAAVVLDDQRRRPGVDLLARLPPQLLAVALVERGNERLAVEVIPDDDDGVAVQRRRGALAELVAHALVAEILLPQERAVHVEGIEAEGFEVGVQPLAVGERRTRRPRAVVGVGSLVRFGFSHDALPHGLAGLPIERHDDEPVHAPLRLRPARRVLRVAGDADWHGGGHVDAVAPDDRRRVSAARDRSFPLDIRGWRPSRRQVLLSRDSGTVRTTPLRPVGGRPGGGK